MDTFDQASRAKIMARVRSKNTKPELTVRKALHAAGYRYRLHVRGLPGRPDIVLPRFRIAAFVQGCFWHGHGCKRSGAPASNVGFWTHKLARNVQRDQETQAALRSAGWNVEIIWGCSLRTDLIALMGTLQQHRGICAEGISPTFDSG